MNPAYSDAKVAWHLDKIQSLRDTGQCIPGQVQLVISDLCNHDCPWCAYRLEGYSSNQKFSGPNGERNPNRRIPTDKALEILDDIAELGIKAVQFTGGGEPTVHKDHIEIFEHALNLGLRCALVTNGSNVSGGLKTVYPKFDWIRVSLDAGRAETYAKLRRVKEHQFHDTLNNISLLASAGANVGVSFVVMKENVSETWSAAGFARFLGANSIRFTAMFSPDLSAYYKGWEAEAEDAVRKAHELHNSPTFSVIDMVGQRIGDLHQGRPSGAFCGYQHMNVYIGGDLNVYRCCNTAYNDLGLVGSLRDQRFAEFWRSEAKAAAYRDFDARSCAHCAFNGKNDLLRYLVNREPLHVDFV